MANEDRGSICYVLPGRDLVPGDGHTRRVLSLARALAAHAEVTVVFRRVLGAVEGEPFQVGELESNSEPSSDDVAPSRRDLGRFVEARCASYGVVLEGSWPLSGKLTAWCAQRGIPAIPVIDHLPPARWLAPLETGRNWIALGASGRYFRRVPVMIAGSEKVRRALVSRWRVSADRIAVVGPAVDRARLHPRDQDEARRRLGLSPDDRILLAGGPLDRRHDLAPVIDAVQRVGDPRLRLHVLGHGEHRAGLERLARGDAAIRFHGRVADDRLADWIAAADLCIAVQDPDAPLDARAADGTFTVGECLAAGRPVAVAAADRHPLVRHLVTGFLLEHDVLAWARFLQRDCPSRNTLRIMGKAASATPQAGMDDVALAYLAAVERARRAATTAAPAV